MTFPRGSSNNGAWKAFSDNTQVRLHCRETSLSLCEGLAPALVRTLEEQLIKLREAGLTILLAEQNVKSALRLSDRGYIIDDGEIRHQGSIEEIRENEHVRKKYLLV